MKLDVLERFARRDQWSLDAVLQEVVTADQARCRFQYRFAASWSDFEDDVQALGRPDRQSIEDSLKITKTRSRREPMEYKDVDAEQIRGRTVANHERDELLLLGSHRREHYVSAHARRRTR